MNRTRLFSALSLTLAIGLAPASALAKDHDRDHHERHERVEHRQRLSNHDRARWEHDRREHQRAEFRREHHEREAMHRWDRDHHRPNGWDNGHKTGWHNSNVPPRPVRTYEPRHHWDRRNAGNHQPIPAVAPARPGRGSYSASGK